jgi:nucleoside-diphosphate-sugar epimerase
MKILVTGSNGFIGTALVKSLIDEGYNVSCLIRPNSLNKIKDVNIIRIKSNSISEVKLALKSRDFDFVINLASYGVRKGDDNLDLMIDGNINFLANLILALPNKPKMFINVGSCSEYGIIENGTFVEESDKINPNTLYGAAKSASHIVGNALAVQQKLKFISLRLFGVFGEGEDKFRLLPYTVENLKCNSAVGLTSGEQQRDVLYIDDVVSAFHSTIENYNEFPSYGSYNVCSGVPVKVKDFIEYIALKMHKSFDLLKWGQVIRPEEPLWLVGNNELFKKYSKWKPKFDMESGLDKAMINFLNG